MNDRKMRLRIVSTVLLALALAAVPGRAQSPHEPVRVAVDADNRLGEMKPVWAWVGYDEPNYTYMRDGRKLLTEFSRLSPVPVYVRTHNLLNTGDGADALKWGSTNIYTEDAAGNPVYDWTIVDRIIDTYVERGMRPLLQMSFMPEALTTGPAPYQHSWTPDAPYDRIYTGWAYPPKDYDKWRELIYRWALHCKERYGEKEVLTWWWDVWNEPDSPYFRGTLEEYCKLYDYAADGLLRAIPGAHVGGPHNTGPGGRRGREFMIGFLEHCLRGTNHATGKIGSPLHYIGFHAKGNPRIVDGAVRMNTGAQLRDAREGFAVVASFPELKNVPIIIGEFDPDGCAACSEDFSPQNAYRNGTLYSSTLAMSYARLWALADEYGVNLEGAVTWAFEFENRPWFAGFRDLYTNGVAKPVLNVFRMFGQMGGELVEARSSAMIPTDSICVRGVRGAADIGVLASRREDETAVMVWNYHDDDVTDVPPAAVELDVRGIPDGRALVVHYRIAAAFSNAYTVWKEMGGPQQPTAGQLKKLENSDDLQLYASPEWVDVDGGTASLSFELPRQGVSLVKISW